METVDVLGYTLGDAKTVLKEKEIIINNIIISAPPKLDIKYFDDSFRVIKINYYNEKKADLIISKPL